MSFAGSGGTTNLAVNRPATASGYTQNYVPASAVDGNTSTYWESTDNAFPQWLQVDLGSATSVGRIVLDLPPSTAWATRTQTITVQGSTDGSNYTTLAASAGLQLHPRPGHLHRVLGPLPQADLHRQHRLARRAARRTASLRQLRAALLGVNAVLSNSDGPGTRVPGPPPPFRPRADLGVFLPRALPND